MRYFFQCYWLFVGLILIGLPAACNKRTSNRNRPQDTLVIYAESEPPHLVGLIQPDSWTHRITYHNLFESLIRRDPRTLTPVGELASTWQVSPDHLTYTFYLRSGVFWHDGHPFSGEDVKFTFDTILNENVRAASARGALEPFILKYQLIKPDQFQIVCKQASPYFFDTLTDIPILPAHLMRKGDLNTHPLLRRPVGTGPYRFDAWKSGYQISLRRNDKYWGSAPRIPHLIYRFISNPEVALKLARRGEVDFISRLKAAPWVNEVQKDPIFQHEFIPTRDFPPGTTYILLNHARPLFKDVRVRRALAMLLDRQTIATKVMHGLGKPVGALYWFKDPHFNAAVVPIPFNPTQAKRLLAEAGYKDSDGNGVLDKDGQPFRLVFSFVTSSQTQKLWLTMYQQELRKVGIVMDISPMDWSLYIQRLRQHQFDAGALGMVVAGLYTDLYYQFHSSQMNDGQNYGGYHNPRVDQLLEQIRTEMNDSKRKQLSGKLQQLLADDVAAIPLFSMEDPGIVHRRVHGVYSSPFWFQIRDWWIE